MFNSPNMEEKTFQRWQNWQLMKRERKKKAGNKWGTIRKLGIFLGEKFRKTSDAEPGKRLVADPSGKRQAQVEEFPRSIHYSFVLIFFYFV